MPRIRLDLSYDGTMFCGWQLQKTDPSVQGALETALETLTGTMTRVIGSGRTDSGVHALNQTAHFDSDASIPPEKYSLALNSILPPGVRIYRSLAVGEDFHARFSARKRTYRYYIKPGPKTSPFCESRVYRIRRYPDILQLNTLASALIGTHDFTTFTAAGDASDSRVRKIVAASFFPKGGLLVFQISGNAFLWRMVRSIVGTLLDLEQKGEEPQMLEKIISARDRNFAGPTAPAQGLYLYKVYYNEPYSD
ncbi:tRNA pseudouridine(38-40) synthase TruA [Marispirochaeta sp.]|jgi:tRNA pseudouridine38-40 synthase|uniref:tRNA pseudouridine(38-40) synthase TruA n=1 Tax=Marispirochaeta sp. TaxID=2038653 RepID=UPI0029C6D354|nr:tRNA pseudouridine(38-40) synthase TruA [Marispirochaeta sp.]